MRLIEWRRRGVAAVEVPADWANSSGLPEGAGKGLNGLRGDSEGAGEDEALEVLEGLFTSFAELIDIAAAFALCSVDTETVEKVSG